ncbi:MAG TPA: major capsid protein [Mycobacteriales bacterium]|nr:major capsid protein [Mycobacteriales bacterium]
MAQLTDARGTVDGENDRRATAADDIAQQRQALVDAFDSTPPADEPDQPAASSRRPSPVPLSRLPQQPLRRRASGAPRTLTAAGMPLNGRRGIAEAFADALHDVSGVSGEFRARVARSEWSYADSRTLTLDDATRNSELIAAATQPDELVAAGGLCSPAMPYYAIDTWAVADRPIRDSLTQLGAPRGAVTFTPPPGLADVAGGISVWTLADDVAATGGAPTKPRLRIACPNPTTVDVQAVPASFEFGNMAGRFYPEWVDGVLATAAAAQARVAESQLLSAMNAAATAVTSAQVAGATRDLLVCIERAAAGLRSRQRMRDDATLQVWLPAWSRSLMRSDIARQLATDTSENNGGALAVTDAQIANWFAVRHLIPTWHLEQQLGAQAAGALIAYPGTVEVTIAPPGSFLFLDGGRLDVGLYRDSTLVETNDYGTFFETFEAVGFIGVEALHLTATVSPNGASNGTIVPAA